MHVPRFPLTGRAMVRLGLLLLVLAPLVSCRQHVVACVSASEAVEASEPAPGPGDPSVSSDSNDQAAPSASAMRAAGAIPAAATGDVLGIGGGAADVEGLSPFGILTPIFPGVGANASTSECDPFDDVYGGCL